MAASVLARYWPPWYVGMMIDTSGSMMTTVDLSALLEQNVQNRTLPDVTIILVTWNAASHIVQALESIRAQSYPLERIQAIVVDNASRDDTVRIVREYFP